MDCKFEVVRGPKGQYRMAVTRHGLLSLSLPKVTALSFKDSVKLLLAKHPARPSVAKPNNIEAHIEQFRSLISSWCFETAWHCFHFPPTLDLRGSKFHLRVWRTLQKLPPGSIESYSALALRSGSKRAARAVGTAMRRNPIPLFVPCHRVVAANGLGGYGGGLALKEFLLSLES